VGLRPNFDLSTVQEWHYSASVMMIPKLPPGMSQAEALSLVRKDFSQFATVNFRGNNVATAEVLPTGIARFHLETISGLASPVMFDPTFMVQLFTTRDAKLGVPVQRAFTVAEHPLQGMRQWYARPSSDGGITITTEAFEVGHHFYGKFGAWLDKKLLGTQQAMWDTYLRNLDARYFGGQGFQLAISFMTGEGQNPLAEPLRQAETPPQPEKQPEQTAP